MANKKIKKKTVAKKVVKKAAGKAKKKVSPKKKVAAKKVKVTVKKKIVSKQKPTAKKKPATAKKPKVKTKPVAKKASKAKPVKKAAIKPAAKAVKKKKAVIVKAVPRPDVKAKAVQKVTPVKTIAALPLAKGKNALPDNKQKAGLPVKDPDAPVKKKAVRQFPKPVVRKPIPPRQEGDPKPPVILSTTKKIFRVEFPVRCSPRILYSYLSSPSGLSAWFAENVTYKEGVFFFHWDDTQSRAKRIYSRENQFVRYQWLDEQDNTYFEFEILEDDLTADVALVVSDFAEPDEIERSTMIWSSQVNQLTQVIGSVY